jgi:NAD-dependent dihydropyrimidine dehydrogenase PreA subunit
MPRGRLACMRVCPTHAIRVRGAGPQVNSALCIDCGKCILACPEGVFRPLTDPWESIQRFPYKVAIPSPTLFAQFPMDVSPTNVVDGLLALGFDAVYPLCTETEMINMAIRDYLDACRGPYPVVSGTCPVVVRLVQVAYPDMVEQIIPIESPREIAGREMKTIYSRRTGRPPEEIGAIYLTPCPCKATSIKQPAENVPSHLDLALAISDLYNPLLSAVTTLKRGAGETGQDHRQAFLRSRVGIAWATAGGESQSLQPSRHVCVSDLPNIIRVLDDIEKGKIRNMEFLECWACTGGCVGGPLTVDDTYVSVTKVQNLIQSISEEDARQASREARRRYVKGDYVLRGSLQPRPRDSRTLSFEKQIARMTAMDDLVTLLPGVDCGLCGAPTCEAFASDWANGRANLEDCVLVSDAGLQAARDRYETAKVRIELAAAEKRRDGK